MPPYQSIYIIHVVVVVPKGSIIFIAFVLINVFIEIEAINFSNFDHRHISNILLLHNYHIKGSTFSSRLQEKNNGLDSACHKKKEIE